MYQIWIQNDHLEYQRIGPPKDDVDANLWLQVLGKHFGSEVRMRPAEPTKPVHVTQRSVWPGER